MALKDILLVIDTNMPCKTRLDMAINIAKAHQAHITGLHIETHSFFEAQDGTVALTLAERQELFEEKISQAGLSGEWISVDLVTTWAGTVDITTQYAHFADLVIIGQSRASDQSFPANYLEQVLAGAGRPVLIVPYAGTVSTIGKRVLTTWTDGPIATRALHDGLPFLKRAEQVTLLSVDPPKQFRKESEQLSAHLERHNIHVKIEKVPRGELSVGDVLLNQVTDMGADLLIVGANPHRSWVSLDMGQTAKHLLKHMTVPVLMSC
jgi:nucleotide-binding universal stress UspA family protein